MPFPTVGPFGGSGSEAPAPPATDFAAHELEEEAHNKDSDAYAELNRSILHWLVNQTSSSQGKAATISSTEVALLHGVPRRLVVDYLRAEQEEAEACRSLPFTFLLIASYSLMAISHDDAKTSRAVEDSLAFDLYDNANFANTADMAWKGLDDVNSIADFWSFLNGGVLPLLFTQEDGFSDGFSDLNGGEDWVFPQAPEERGFWVEGRNRIVGGIRFVQERSITEEGLCVSQSSTSKALLKLYDIPCVSGQNQKFLMYPESQSPPDSTRVTDNPTRQQWFYAFDDYDDLQQKLWDMERGTPETGPPWFDRHTQKIEIAIPVYNAEFGVHVLLLCNFYINRGGHFWKRIIPSSVKATDHPSDDFFVYDGVYFACLFYILINELAEIRDIFKTKGTMGLLFEYTNVWNLIDWASVGWGFMVVCYWYANYELRETMNDDLKDLTEIGFRSAYNGGEDREKYIRKLESYFRGLEDCTKAVHMIRNFLAIYPMIVIFRSFKSFNAQPRLAMVTKTIAAAFSDLFHFLIVFFSVFGTFVLFGIVLMGRESPDSFVDATKSVMTCFRILFGDVDWAELSTVGREEATIWLWSYIIMLVMLMWNMILAIIMDHYEQVKEGMGYKETLLEELEQNYSRWRNERAGIAIPMDDILDVLTSGEKVQVFALLEQPAIKRVIEIVKGKDFVEEPELAYEFDPENCTESERERHNDEDDTFYMLDTDGDEVIAEPEPDPKLADAADTTKTFSVDIADFNGSHDEEEGDGPVVTVEVLLNIVNRKRTEKQHMLMEHQAGQILKMAVEDYYEKNVEGAELEEVLGLCQKVNRRTQKVLKMVRAAHTGSDHKVASETRWLQESIDRYVEMVKTERGFNLGRLEELRYTREELRKRLNTVSPNIIFPAHEDEMDNRVRRRTQSLATVVRHEQFS